MGVPEPYTIGPAHGADHTSPYNYDTHVPLALYGLPFQPGVYRTHAEPVDMAALVETFADSELPEEPVVRRHGGRVVIIPLLDGYSTSRLVSAAGSWRQPRSRSCGTV